MKLSVIFPIFKEKYASKTIESFLSASELGDDVELIPVFDGGRSVCPIPNDPRVKPVKFRYNRGMRQAINAGIEASTGEYICKIDAHCAFDKGFDRKMLAEMQDDWLLIPRRYSLHEETWTRDDTRPFRDYHYLEYPHPSKYGSGLTVLEWLHKNDKEIDDTMIFQGSCWLAKKDYFMKTVGLLDDVKYGSFVAEQHEIGLKYWLKGGAIKVNKKTWYAHLSKRPKHYEAGLFDRRGKSAPETAKYHTFTADWWMGDKELGIIRTFADYINQFKPPTWKLPYVN
jgi:glycosyltransferase involved in cell wall biosynthesis